MVKRARASERLSRRSVKIAALALKANERLKTYQNMRLAAGFVFFLALVVLAIRPDLKLELPVLLAFLIFFVWLVIATRNIARYSDQLVRLNLFFRRQLKRCDGGAPPDRDGSAALAMAQKHASCPPFDIGLFGPLSLWTLIDETITEGGLRRLLGWMLDEPLPAPAIENRQRRLRDLRGEAWFYTRLTLGASDRAEMRASTREVTEFLGQPFVDDQTNKIYIANLVIWLVVVLFTALSVFRGWGLGGYAVLVFAVVSQASLSRVGSAFKRGVGLSHYLGELLPLFRLIEKRVDHSPRLGDLVPRIKNDRPSARVRSLNFALGFLGTQTNPLLHIVLNLFLPWTLTAAIALERQRKQLRGQFPDWMEELSELEAMGSLILFDRYQTRCYPTLSESQTAFQFTGLYHPLLDRKKVVANDFEFPTGKSLGLLTGSNMSGKSTFLRTIGINQTLANMGAPVFADAFSTRPTRVETCIEVSDSLRDGFSYFYAEVRRLKMILDAVRDSSRPVIFLIDEIFRGTNNRERQVGSRAVIRTLARSPQSVGFVSTHDLELTSLEETSPKILNLHFKEDIDPNGKMIFSYRLNRGPCPTTNALKIMEAEGIDLNPID